MVNLDRTKLQALVYDILPPTTPITDYAIGLKKPSANGQIFLGAQMAVSLQQKLRLYQAIRFITAHVAYASTG